MRDAEGFSLRGTLPGQERCWEPGPVQGGAGGQEGAAGRPPRSLTSQVLARGVVLVMDPLGRRGVEVGLGGGEAQGVVAGPHRQADVEGVRGDDAVLVHQPPRGQLRGESGSGRERGSGRSVLPSPAAPAPSPHTWLKLKGSFLLPVWMRSLYASAPSSEPLR